METSPRRETPTLAENVLLPTRVRLPAVQSRPVYEHRGYRTLLGRIRGNIRTYIRKQLELPPQEIAELLPPNKPAPIWPGTAPGRAFPPATPPAPPSSSLLRPGPATRPRHWR